MENQLINKKRYIIVLICITIISLRCYSQSREQSIYSFLRNNNLTNKTEDEFIITYADTTKAKELYSFYLENKLTDDSFDNFYKSIILNEETLYTKWNTSPREIKLKLIYQYLLPKNPELEDIGFDGFARDMNDEKNLKNVYYGLSKKHSKWKTISYEIFRKEMVPGFNQDRSVDDKDIIANSAVSTFQTDKIKIGNSFIDLPIPTGFVKIDESDNTLFESAKKMCPESNTLLAYYLSGEDYANFLAHHSSSFDKYILVEVFNGLKEKEVGSKDYRQFINSFKREYIDKFQKDLDKGGLLAVENLSKVYENLRMENIKMQPLGIFYESENSLSYGILSKYTFTVDNESSNDYVVAAISTITKVDQKPIFLYSYQTYKSKEDINSLKALNASWVKEIDKKQSPVSFLSDFDFKDYKEAIFAIITLSFIWAIYFATKKIQRKLITKNIKENQKREDNIEYLDLDEIFTEEKVSIDPIPLNEPDERIQEKAPIANPELLKANRRLRFFNLLIDLIFLYFLAYMSVYVLVFLFGQTIASKLMQNQYLFGSSLTFIIYFVQELMFSKTLGKVITKTHVVNNLSQRPTIWQLILRSASRVIPFEAITYLSAEKRGLHDIISKTYVIKD